MYEEVEAMDGRRPNVGMRMSREEMEDLETEFLVTEDHTTHQSPFATRVGTRVHLFDRLRPPRADFDAAEPLEDLDLFDSDVLTKHSSEASEQRWSRLAADSRRPWRDQRADKILGTTFSSGKDNPWKGGKTGESIMMRTRGGR